jgi:hypothetical protein
MKSWALLWAAIILVLVGVIAARNGAAYETSVPRKVVTNERLMGGVLSVNIIDTAHEPDFLATRHDAVSYILRQFRSIDVRRSTYGNAWQHYVTIHAILATRQRDSRRLFNIGFECRNYLESRCMSRIGPIHKHKKILTHQWVRGLGMWPEGAQSHPRTLFIFQNRKLILRGIGLRPQLVRSVLGFLPSIRGENGEQKRESSNQKMRKTFLDSECASKPTEERPKTQSDATNDRTSMLPAICIIGAAICFIIGIGMIAVGGHVFGILLLAAGLYLGFWPYMHPIG